VSDVLPGHQLLSIDISTCQDGLLSLTCLQQIVGLGVVLVEFSDSNDTTNSQTGSAIEADRAGRKMLRESRQHLRNMLRGRYEEQLRWN